MSVDAPIGQVDVACYEVPTDAPESDGTIEWDSTTVVVVQATAGGKTGLGYTYSSTAAARLVKDKLAHVVRGKDAMAVPAAWAAMVHAVRNVPRPGIAMAAISAVDGALWDLKARLFGVPLVTLLGQARPSVPVYGSGGFTSYTMDRIRRQLAGWVEGGIPSVKMKVGRAPSEDLGRARAAREAIGPTAGLMVDANGAYDRKEALLFATAYSDLGISWFEEPVSSDDLDGLRLLRDRGPAGMDITAGEYGYDAFYFRRMLAAGAVDVLQVDATRCGGITGYLRAAALCEATPLPMSAHTAPSLHTHPSCALTCVRNIEYFHDHARLEPMLFDGALAPVGGALHPDLGRPGMGLSLKRADAEPFAVPF